MASAALRDELSCSICLDLYKEPVSLRCGHSYCRECIGVALDAQEGSGVYFCPDCREEYEERPTLEKNRKLCNIVDNFRSTKQEEKSNFRSAQQREEESEIFCVYCVDSPVRAVKSCLHCETSMCDKHLTAHNKSVDHVLIEPTSSFGGKKCSIHNKLLEYYCSEDAVYLCVSCCLVGQHQGHKVELLEVALAKEKFKHILENLITKREATEQKIQNLQEQKRKAKKRKKKEKKRVSDLFEDLRRQLDVKEEKVLSEISRYLEEVSISTNSVIKQLEMEKDELSRKINHIEKMCNMTDPISVLQDSKSYTDKILQGDMNVEESSAADLDDFMISLVLHRSITGLYKDLQLKNNFYEQDPSSLLLDIKTVNYYVSLSNDLKTASDGESVVIRPDLPGRFKLFPQVMSVQNFFHGRHYWEVEVNDVGDWYVGVCYPSIERDDMESLIGNNNKSWTIRKYKNEYNYMHNSQIQALNPEPPVQRLGIYLDYEKGRLSYYQLFDHVRHLHTFTATFTEPLHVIFFVDKEAWVKSVSPVFYVEL